MRWSLDSQGALSHVCRDWRHFTGLSEAEAIGRDPWSTVHPDDQRDVATIVRAAVQARLPFLVTCRFCGADRNYQWAIAQGAPSFAPVHGSLLGYLGSTELLDRAPDPPRVTDILHLGLERSQQRVVMLDALAGHVMAARTIAKQTDDLSVTKILDVALLSIGDLLYATMRR